MIVVLADDLSGAAELAGLAVSHGLTAEVQTTFSPDTDVDVLCLDTDTRLLPAADAARCLSELAPRILAAQADWIFKKCDSVLRGPVLAEARAFTGIAGLTRLLLIPANPLRNRVIHRGEYLVAGIPLHQTAFARDPHHPRTSARVTDLLGGDLTGVRVPDILTTEDIEREARTLDTTTLPVGAADFFRALLNLRVPAKSRPLPTSPTRGRQLRVCGSAAAWPARHAEAKVAGLDSHALPHDLPAITRSLGASGETLVGIGDGPATQGRSPLELTAQLVRTVTRVQTETRPGVLLLEGGDTAAAVIRSLGWTRLRVVDLVGDVAALEPVDVADAPRIFIKPGSYAWPSALAPVAWQSERGKPSA